MKLLKWAAIIVGCAAAGATVYCVIVGIQALRFIDAMGKFLTGQ